MWGSGDNSGPGNSSGGISTAAGIVSQVAGNPRRSSSSNSKSSRSAKGIYRLLAFVVFCGLVYKAWGPLLLVTCALAVILHLCCSLCVSDSLFTPCSLVLLGHTKNLAVELLQTSRGLFGGGLDKSKLVLKYLRRQYRERFRRQLEAAAVDDSMSDSSRNLYRPSILMNKNLADNLNARNNELYNSFTLNGISSISKTSTPIPRGSNFGRNEKQNGGVNIFTPTTNILSKKNSPLRSENKPTLNLSQSEDILYNSKNSSWNHSMSPKIKDKSESLKTVQTVAGPLLNSSRYNMDPKLYTDISSPGITSRLTKYAAEANSKLTHQSQYGTGQFPKVNLNASPIPVLSPKVVKSRMPVTVRVAPPEITNYSLADGSSQQDKSKIYSPTAVRESKSCTNEFQVLKKMALKRHASRDDIILDFKKQKSDQEFEMMQKRTRDESTMSDDELSPQSNNERPTKRSKSSSCHDILHSLSSSTSVPTGVKRKNMDSSRCSSPDNEKHFKLSHSSISPNKSSSLTLLSSKEVVKSKEQLNVKVPNVNAFGEPHQNKVQQKTPETPKPVDRSPEKKQPSPTDTVIFSTPKITREISPLITKSEKLTDKLFMKPEPLTNEKLKSLIKEQGKVEAQFKTDNKDEIKKQDIDNMRQNSMRMRLKSMFDAISGKSASKINPDVVIQAEEVNSSPPTTTASFATLNSLTTTTTVNTSPITTTIVPILKSDTDNKSQAAPKRVSFNLPASSSSLTSSSSSNLSTISNSNALKPTETKTTVSSSLGGFNTTTTSTPSFNFGNKSDTSTAVTSSSINPASSGGFSFSASSRATTTSTSTATSSITSTPFSPKSSAVTITSSGSSATTTSGFSFGTPTTAKTTSPTSTFSFTPSATSPSFSYTSPTSSAPSFSFSSNTTSSTAPTFSFNSNNSLTSVRSTESTTSTPVLSFGNTISKSPSSTSFAPVVTSSSASLGSNPTSIFGVQSTSSPFSKNNNTIASSTTSTPVTTSAQPQLPPAFNFNAGKSTPGGFSFNAPVASTTSTASNTTPKSTFSFGSNTQNKPSSTGGTSTFAVPAASSNTSAAPTPAFNSTPSLFNTPTNAPSIFSGASTMGSSPMFKGPATTTAAASSTPSIFGSSTSGFGVTSAPTATTTTPSIFGNNTPASTIPSLFGNTASTAISTASSVSPFGAPATQPQQQSSIFSGVNATTSSSIFGSSTPSSLFSNAGSTSTNPASTTSSADSTNIFGQSKPVTFGGTTSAFGTNNQSSGFSLPSMSSSSSNQSAFQIGSAPSTNSIPTFGKPTSTFGSPANTSSGSIFGSTTGGAFGSANTNPPPAFGSTTPGGTFGTTSSSGTFGSAAPSSTFGSGTSAPGSTFGSGTSAPGSTFGSSASSPATGAFGSASSAPGNTFGSAASAQSSTFGSATSAPNSTFGSSAPAFGSGSSTFGSPAATNSPFGGAPTSTQAPPLFGNTPATSSTSGGTFSFGGAQSTQQPAQQPNSSFNFNSANNASATGGGGMFQFGGASTAARPAGFNFNAPTGAPAINFSGSAAPPAFNAPAPNMFSIGSGSSTSRTRSSRQRRQR